MTTSKAPLYSNPAKVRISSSLPQASGSAPPRPVAHTAQSSREPASPSRRSGNRADDEAFYSRVHQVLTTENDEERGLPPQERDARRQRTHTVLATLFTELELDISDIDMSRLHLHGDQDYDSDASEGPVPMVSVRSQRTTATVVALQPSPRRGHAGAGSAQGYPHRNTPGRISREPEDEVLPSTFSRACADLPVHGAASGAHTRSTSNVSSVHPPLSVHVPQPHVPAPQHFPPVLPLPVPDSQPPAPQHPDPEPPLDVPTGIRQIDPDGDNEGRRWYAITRGKGKIGVFATWVDAAPYCSDIRGAHYQGFKTRAGALRAFLRSERQGNTSFI